MQHASLIALNHFWRIELDQLLQAIVAVDDAAIQIVQIRRCKPTTTESDHWTEVWWDDWQYRQAEAGWLDAGSLHALEHLQALEQFLLALTLGMFGFLAQLGDQF